MDIPNLMDRPSHEGPMRIPMVFVFFGLAMLVGLPLQAQEAPPPVSSGAKTLTPAELVKSVQIHPKPKDFGESLELAIRNREDRLELVRKSTECVQKAKILEEINACQETERQQLSIIRLAYCETGVSFITGRARSTIGQTWPEGTPDECARATWAITNQPMNWTEEQRQAGAKALITDLRAMRDARTPPAAGTTPATPAAPAQQGAAPVQPPAR
jgi:hypothetical protein